MAEEFFSEINLVTKIDEKSFNYAAQQFNKFGGVEVKLDPPALAKAGTQLKKLIEEIPPVKIDAKAVDQSIKSIRQANAAAAKEASKALANTINKTDTKPFAENLSKNVEGSVGSSLKSMAATLTAGSIAVQVAGQIFGDIINGLAQTIRELLSPILDLLTDTFQKITPMLKSLLEPIASALMPIMDYLTDVIGNVIDILAPIIEVIGKVLMAVLKPIMNVVSKLLPIVTKIIMAFMPLVEQLLPMVIQMMPGIQMLVLAAEGVGWLLEKMMPAINAVTNFIQDLINKVVKFIAQIPFLNIKLEEDTNQFANSIKELSRNIDELNGKAIDGKLTEEQQKQMDGYLASLEQAVGAQEQLVAQKEKEYGVNSSNYKREKEILDTAKAKLESYKQQDLDRKNAEKAVTEETKEQTKQTEERAGYMLNILDTLKQINDLTKKPLEFKFEVTKSLHDAIEAINAEAFGLQEQLFNAQIQYAFDSGTKQTLKDFQKQVTEFYQSEGFTGTDLELKVLEKIIGNSEALKLNQKQLDDLTNKQKILQNELLKGYDKEAKITEIINKDLKARNDEILQATIDLVPKSAYGEAYSGLFAQQKQYAAEVIELQAMLQEAVGKSDSELLTQRIQLIDNFQTQIFEKVKTEQKQQIDEFNNSIKEIYAGITDYTYDFQSELARIFDSGDFSFANIFAPASAKLEKEQQNLQAKLEKTKSDIAAIGKSYEELVKTDRTGMGENELIALEKKIAKAQELQTELANTEVAIRDNTNATMDANMEALKAWTDAAAAVGQKIVDIFVSYMNTMDEMRKKQSELQAKFYSDTTLLDAQLAAGLTAYSDYFKKVNEMNAQMNADNIKIMQEANTAQKAIINDTLKAIINSALDSVQAAMIEAILSSTVKALGASILDPTTLFRLAGITAGITVAVQAAKAGLNALLGHSEGGLILPHQNDIHGKEDTLRWLSYGESVMNKKATQKYGDIIFKMNKGTYEPANSDKEMLNEMRLMRQELNELKHTELKRNLNIKSFVNTNPNGIIRTIKYAQANNIYN